MTASSTPCCARRSWLVLLLSAWLALFAAAAARADGIEVRSAALVSSEDGYYLEASFEIVLTNVLEEALSKGVPLHFLVEFELIRPRWYWFNEKIVSRQYAYRLSYNALTRQYRVAVGSLFQNFPTLNEALELLRRVRRHEAVEKDALGKDTTYTAAVRMRLDTAQLPRPFQLSAVGSRDWTVSSEWLRWTVVP